MAVYCDPMMRCLQSAAWKWPTSCHLFSDDIAELHSFARQIGMRLEWFQHSGRIPHYDLNERRRSMAVRNGVVELTSREAVEFWRKHWPRDQPPETER